MRLPITRLPNYPITRLPNSKVELGSDLDEPRLQHIQRFPPDRVRGFLLQNRIRVEQVVQIEVDVRARPADANNLREPQVDLLQSIAILRSRLDDVDRLERDAGQRHARL